MRWNNIWKTFHFLQITAEIKIVHVKAIKNSYQNIWISRSSSFRWDFTDIESAIEGKRSRERFSRKSSQGREIQLQVK